MQLENMKNKTRKNLATVCDMIMYEKHYSKAVAEALADELFTVAGMFSKYDAKKTVKYYYDGLLTREQYEKEIETGARRRGNYSSLSSII